LRHNRRAGVAIGSDGQLVLISWAFLAFRRRRKAPDSYEDFMGISSFRKALYRHLLARPKGVGIETLPSPAS